MGGRNDLIPKLVYRASKYLFLRRMERTKLARISGSWVRILMVVDGQVLFNYCKNPLKAPASTFIEYLDGWPKKER